MKDYTALPFQAMKTTSFRKAIWEIMLTILFGQTMTYGENSLIISCHRVVGTNGSLTGYAAFFCRRKERHYK